MRILNGSNRERMRRREAAVTANWAEKKALRRRAQYAVAAYQAHQRLCLAVAPKRKPNYYASNKEPYYKAAYKRRALLKAAPYEYIRRSDVFEEEGWRCRVCGKTVRDDVSKGHPRKAVMAHIVALAAGGGHTRDNVCCLCHQCNSRDGVNRISIQRSFPS